MALAHSHQEACDTFTLPSSTSTCTLACSLFVNVRLEQLTTDIIIDHLQIREAVAQLQEATGIRL